MMNGNIMDEPLGSGPELTKTVTDLICPDHIHSVTIAANKEMYLK